MARTALTPNTGVVTNPAAGAALVWTAADVANGNKVALTGKELVLAWNTHATTPYTVTMTSAADGLGRTKDITTESIAAGDIHQFGVPQLEGWRQSDGTLSLNAENAAIKFAIVRLPG
jgi:hypothetical protein